MINKLAQEINKDSWQKYAIYGVGVAAGGIGVVALSGGIALIISSFGVPIPGLNVISQHIPHWGEGLAGGGVVLTSLIALGVMGVIAYKVKNKVAESEKKDDIEDDWKDIGSTDETINPPTQERTPIRNADSKKKDNIEDDWEDIGSADATINPPTQERTPIRNADSKKKNEIDGDWKKIDPPDITRKQPRAPIIPLTDHERKILTSWEIGKNEDVENIVATRLKQVPPGANIEAYANALAFLFYEVADDDDKLSELIKVTIDQLQKRNPLNNQGKFYPPVFIYRILEKVGSNFTESPVTHLYFQKQLEKHLGEHIYELIYKEQPLLENYDQFDETYFEFDIRMDLLFGGLNAANREMPPTFASAIIYALKKKSEDETVAPFTLQIQETEATRFKPSFIAPLFKPLNEIAKIIGLRVNEGEMKWDPDQREYLLNLPWGELDRMDRSANGMFSMSSKSDRGETEMNEDLDVSTYEVSDSDISFDEEDVDDTEDTMEAGTTPSTSGEGSSQTTTD